MIGKIHCNIFLRQKSKSSQIFMNTFKSQHKMQRVFMKTQLIFKVVALSRMIHCSMTYLPVQPLPKNRVMTMKMFMKE